MPTPNPERRIHTRKRNVHERRLPYRRGERTQESPLCFSAKEIQDITGLLSKLKAAQTEIFPGIFSPSYAVDLVFADEPHDTPEYLGGWALPDQDLLRQSAGIQISFHNSKTHPMSIEQRGILEDFLEEIVSESSLHISYGLQHGINTGISREKNAELMHLSDVRKQFLKYRASGYLPWDLGMSLQDITSFLPDENLIENFVIIFRHHSQEKDQK